VVIPDARYECWKCKFQWEGYRALPDKEGVYHRIDSHGGRGMTDFPRCHHNYVTRLNWEETRKVFGR
jgi:hypothetical protein